jgi:hypothetical protein
MYSLNMPVSALRTKMRQEFERHRYVSQIGVVDVLLTQSHSEFQVYIYSLVDYLFFSSSWNCLGGGMGIAGSSGWGEGFERTLG